TELSNFIGAVIDERAFAKNKAAIDRAKADSSWHRRALGVLLCSLAAARMRRRLLGLAGFALVTALVVGASWAVAEEALPDGLMISLEGQLTGNRVLLWQDAVTLAKEHPVLGVGPDRFAEMSPTAQQTLRSDGKPHSAPLQQAAEQGVVGVTLLGAAFGWLLYVLRRSPRSTAVVLTAGAALTALAALASVGNALSFTPVTAGAGLLAGLASARLPIGDGRAASDTAGAADGTRTEGDKDTGRSAQGTRTTAERGPRADHTPP
ncbi:O-antigen ligase family protein, partial [Streptomyces sp. NPDC079189]|uniref:O-antigen ligase family protein n=1 Tax=Streptomyces sp. NPDC079189 TaxID=3154514 RepID=UPI003422C909